MNALYNINFAWRNRLYTLMGDSPDVIKVSPRGKPIREQLHQRLVVDMRCSLLDDPLRKISRRFAAAEALWIMDGKDDLASLLPYNKRMADFSDDGEKLAGAYGPRLAPQLGYVLAKLLEDTDTRQAVASIWTPNPEPSKDIPCTLSLAFQVRQSEMHCHVFMRSSDVWLGVPYDVFSFSCITAALTMRYNEVLRHRHGEAINTVDLGRLWLTAASSHLYAENFSAARAVLDSNATKAQPVITMRMDAPPGALRLMLEMMRDE